MPMIPGGLQDPHTVELRRKTEVETAGGSGGLDITTATLGSFKALVAAKTGPLTNTAKEYLERGGASIAGRDVFTVSIKKSLLDAASVTVTRHDYAVWTAESLTLEIIGGPLRRTGLTAYVTFEAISKS